MHFKLRKNNCLLKLSEFIASRQARMPAKRLVWVRERERERENEGRRERESLALLPPSLLSTSGGNVTGC